MQNNIRFKLTPPKFVLVMLAIGWLFQPNALAQFDIPRSVVGNGGGVMQNSDFRIVGTVGQPVIGQASVASHTVSSGFWYFPFPKSLVVHSITFNTIPPNRGWFDNTGVHNAGLDNTFTGFHFGFTLRSFFIWDISALNRKVVESVKIHFVQDANGGTDEPNTLEQIAIYDVSTSTSLLTLEYSRNDPAGIEIYNDLGSGALYGTFSAQRFGTQAHVVALSSQAVTDLNNAISSGVFAIGMHSLTGTGPGSDGIRFGASDTHPHIHRLIVHAYDAVSSTARQLATAEKHETEFTSAPWDVNSDGTVNVFDLIQVASQFGQQGENLEGDVNVDGIVNISDLVLVGSHFGEDTPAAPSLIDVRQLSRELAVSNYERVHRALTELEGMVNPSEGAQIALEFLRAWLASARETVTETKVLPNYPNPFNPETWIPYQLAQDASVTLTIYDATGKTVRRLEIGHQLAGRYISRDKAIYWDGRNNLGEPVSSGIYLYRFHAGKYSAMKKMVILK